MKKLLKSIWKRVRRVAGNLAFEAAVGALEEAGFDPRDTESLVKAILQGIREKEKLKDQVTGLQEELEILAADYYRERVQHEICKNEMRLIRGQD